MAETGTDVWSSAGSEQTDGGAAFDDWGEPLNNWRPCDPCVFGWICFLNGAAASVWSREVDARHFRSMEKGLRPAWNDELLVATTKGGGGGGELYQQNAAIYFFSCVFYLSPVCTFPLFVFLPSSSIYLAAISYHHHTFKHHQLRYPLSFLQYIQPENHHGF